MYDITDKEIFDIDASMLEMSLMLQKHFGLARESYTNGTYTVEEGITHGIYTIAHRGGDTCVDVTIDFERPRGWESGMEVDVIWRKSVWGTLGGSHFDRMMGRLGFGNDGTLEMKDEKWGPGLTKETMERIVRRIKDGMEGEDNG